MGSGGLRLCLCLESRIGKGYVTVTYWQARETGGPTLNDILVIYECESILSLYKLAHVGLFVCDYVSY